MNKTLTMLDIPLLVFGGQSDGIVLVDAFAKSFNSNKNKEVWKSISAVPLMQSVLHSDNIHHEVHYTENGNVDMEADPKTAKLLAIEVHNKLCCDLLSAKGCDSDQFQLEVPKQAYQDIVAMMTVPLSKARQDAIQHAKTAGSMFHATDGGHLNSDDLFIAREHDNHTKQIEELSGGH